MTKHQFMERLETELKRNNIPDACDIIEEYEQHFAFKLADGYAEEEISAKLGDPKNIAAQFDSVPSADKKVLRLIAVTGLGTADLFFGLFCVLLFAWEIVLAAFAVACFAEAVCLIGGLQQLAAVSIVPMPYYCAVLFGVLFIALGVLAVVAVVYFFRFIRQLMRAFSRFHRNTLTSASGGASLPALTVFPQFSPAAKRALKKTALAAGTVFAVFCVACYVVCAISAGSMGFWHIWGWFGYIG